MCAAVLEEYCGSVFWNSSYVTREDPDLPVCVEQTVLVWIPLGVLWICAPWHLLTLCRRTKDAKYISKLYACKQAVASLLFLTAIASLAVTLGEDFGPTQDTPTPKKNPTVYYANPIIYAVSWVMVLLCQEGLRRRGSIDSAILFLFWFLTVLCGVFPLQTIIREALRQGEIVDLPRFCLVCISFGLELIALILSALADISPETREVVKKNPEAGAPFLNRITFNWFNSMAIRGYRQPLVQEDMWALNEEDATGYISQHFQHFMKTEFAAARHRYQKRLAKKQNNKSHNETFLNGLSSGLEKGISQDVLMMEDKGKKEDKKTKKTKKKKEEENYPTSWLIPTIYKTFKGVLLESAFFKLLQDLLSFVSPQLLKLMITFTQDKSRYAWEGYLYAVLLLVVALLQSLFLQQYFQRCFVLGMKVRTAIMAAVYKKALVVSNDTRKESTVGETVNLMSADAQRFNDVTNFIHLLWSCPLQIVLSIVFLWQELGPSVLAGLLVMILMVPINGLLATKARKFQIENMKFKDKRLKIMNEILNGMKILKLYAWEPSFLAQVEDIRGQELNVMKKFAYLTSVSTFIFSCAPAVVSLATFAVFVVVSSDNVLTAEKAFTSISLFNILRFPLSMLPMLIAAIVQTTVSRKRLEKFLGGEDLESDIVRHDPSFSSAINVCNGSFSWEKDAEPQLKNVSLDVKPGRLVAVVGAVGSGKSSLMSAILGEMHSNKGFINIQEAPVPALRQLSTPVSTPRQLSAPVSTPRQLSAPVSTPRRLSAPVPAPRQLSTPVPTARRLSAPVSAPRRLSAPVPDPRRFSVPVPAPRQRCAQDSVPPCLTSESHASRCPTSEFPASRHLNPESPAGLRPTSQPDASLCQSSQPVASWRPTADPVASRHLTAKPVSGLRLTSEPVASRCPTSEPVASRHPPPESPVQAQRASPMSSVHARRATPETPVQAWHTSPEFPPGSSPVGVQLTSPGSPPAGVQPTPPGFPPAGVQPTPSPAGVWPTPSPASPMLPTPLAGLQWHLNHKPTWSRMRSVVWCPG